MSLYRVIDKVESTVKDGTWLPFGYRIVSVERVLDLVEKLRGALPEEVGRAKQVTKEKDRLLTQAKEEAEKMVEAATTAKSQMLDENEIAREARDRANALVEQAEVRAAQVRRGADEYADRVLAQLDATLGGALASVQKGRQSLAAGLAASAGNGALARERKG